MLNVFMNLNDFEKFIIGERILDAMNHPGGWEQEAAGIFVRQRVKGNFMID